MPDVAAPATTAPPVDPVRAALDDPGRSGARLRRGRPIRPPPSGPWSPRRRPEGRPPGDRQSGRTFDPTPGP